MMSLEEKKNEKSEYDGPPLSSQPHPWLVICPARKPQGFFSISEDRSYERSIHEFGNTIIRASAHEWLVLEDYDSTDCYLWNPISNHKIQLPPLPYNDRLECLLSAPLNDPECRVLFLIHETTPPDDDDDDDNTDDENSNDDTDDDTNTNGDDTGNENSDDDDDDDDDTDNENPDDDDDDDDTDNENPDDNDMNDDTDSDDDGMDSNDGDTDSNDDDIDNEDPDDDANDDNPNDDENRVALYFCMPGYDEEFHKQDMKSITGDDRFLAWTVFKGNFYVLTWQTEFLLRLDVDDSSGTISTTPMTNQPPIDHFIEFIDMPRFGNYLFQSSSSHDYEDEVELLYVRILFYGREFEDVYTILVFRFDFVKKVWEEMKSIGETAIFLGADFGGTTCSTRGTNLKKESIYFPKGRYLYIFNLETQSISVSLPCPEISMKNPRSYWLTLMAT